MTWTTDIQIHYIIRRYVQIWITLAFIEDLDVVRKLIFGVEAQAIVQFIKENPGTTTDNVAKHLQDEKICSRLTTLALIEKLRFIRVIIDQRKGKYFHSLYYNEDFSLADYLKFLLDASKNDVRKAFSTYLGKDQDKEIDRLLSKANSDVNELVKKTEQKKPKANLTTS